MKHATPITLTSFVKTLIGDIPIAGSLITIGEITTESGTDGSYTIPLPNRGTYAIHVAHPYHHDYDSVLEFLESQEFNIRLRPAQPTPTPTFTPTFLALDSISAT